MNPANDVRQIPAAGTSPSYSLSLRIKLANRPGVLGGLTTMIGRTGGNIEAIDTVDVSPVFITRDITVDAASDKHGETNPGFLARFRTAYRRS